MVRLVVYVGAGFYAGLVYTGHADMAAHFAAAANAVADFIPVALEVVGAWL